MQQNACVETVSVSQFYLTNLVQDELFEKIKLTNSAKLVLLRLVRHYNPEKATVYPSQDYISKKTNITKRSVISSINELRKKGLIIYDTKNVNHYRFTPLFWKLVNFSPEGGKNFTSGSEIFSPKQITEQINKKRYKNFKKTDTRKNGSEKNGFNNFSNQPAGQNYKSVETTKKEQQEKENIKLGSPLDYTKEESLNYLKGLIPSLKNTYFAKALRKKWNFSAEELNQPVENFQPQTKSHILGDNLTSEVDKECLAGKSSLLNIDKNINLTDLKTFPEL